MENLTKLKYLRSLVARVHFLGQNKSSRYELAMWEKLLGRILSAWGKNTQPNINHENTGGFVTSTYPILAGVGRCFHLAQSRNLAQPAGLMPGGIFHSANSIDQSVVPHDRREFGIFTIMSFVFQPWQLYMVILCGWMNRQQQEVIEYLQTENRVLKEKLGAKRIISTTIKEDELASKEKY